MSQPQAVQDTYAALGRGELPYQVGALRQAMLRNRKMDKMLDDCQAKVPHLRAKHRVTTLRHISDAHAHRLASTLSLSVRFDGRLDVRVLAQRALLWEARLVTGEELSDEALIYAIARGDRAALAQLYDRQAPLLLGLGARILARSASAREVEDVLHDVFVEVWKHAGDFDPERASARTWLCLRMRSRCLDRARAAARRRTEPLEDALIEPLPESQSGVADATRVRHALDGLPEPQRQVLVLGYFQGLSSQEIADTLQIPLGTVKSRVAAALTHLRGLLCEKGSEKAEGLAS